MVKVFRIIGNIFFGIALLVLICVLSLLGMVLYNKLGLSPQYSVIAWLMTLVVGIMMAYEYRDKELLEKIFG